MQPSFQIAFLHLPPLWMEFPDFSTILLSVVIELYPVSYLAVVFHLYHLIITFILQKKFIRFQKKKITTLSKKKQKI